MNARYTDDEAAAILARAAELSARPSGAPGVTLEELERIAEEAGIDPALVRRAAATSGDAPALSERVFGPIGAVFQVELDGELDDAGRGAVLEVIQRGLGEHAHSGAVGKVMTAGVRREGRNVQVVVSSKGGKTRVVVEERLVFLQRQTFTLGLAAFIALLTGGWAAAAAALGPEGAAAVAVGAGAATAFGTRVLYGALAKRRTARLRRIFDDVSAAAAASVTSNAVLTATATGSASALDEARQRQGLAPAPPGAEASAQGPGTAATDTAAAETPHGVEAGAVRRN